MKKGLIILLIVAVVLGFGGCESEKSQLNKAQEKIIEIGEQFLDYELTSVEAREKLDSVIVPESDGDGSLLDVDKDFLSYLILKSEKGTATFEEIEDKLTVIKETDYEDLNKILNDSDFTAKTETTKHFEFTADEFVSKLEEDWLIDMQFLHTVDDEENSQEIAVYTSQSDVYNLPAFDFGEYNVDNMMHYHIYCDEITNKVSGISLFIDKNSMDDINEVCTLFYYHISSIAQTIDPNLNTEEISETISNVDDIKEGVDHYEFDDFGIDIFSSSSFSANFMAN